MRTTNSYPKVFNPVKLAPHQKGKSIIAEEGRKWTVMRRQCAKNDV
jgi:hypothetical protein